MERLVERGLIGGKRSSESGTSDVGACGTFLIGGKRTLKSGASYVGAGGRPRCPIGGKRISEFGTSDIGACGRFPKVLVNVASEKVGGVAYVCT